MRGLADRQQDQTFTFAEDFRGINNILWSKDGDVFAITSGVLPEYQWVWQVSNYTQRVSNAVVFTPFVSPKGDFDYTLRGTYDIRFC